MTPHHPAHEVELYRDGDVYEVVVDLPDYDSADIDVDVHDERVHVSAEHVDPDSGRKAVYHRRISVPHEIEVADVTASFDDGLLEIRLPIGSDERPGRHVEVT